MLSIVSVGQECYPGTPEFEADEERAVQDAANVHTLSRGSSDPALARLCSSGKPAALAAQLSSC